jgi:hypothetical protein
MCKHRKGRAKNVPINATVFPPSVSVRLRAEIYMRKQSLLSALATKICNNAPLGIIMSICPSAYLHLLTHESLNGFSYHFVLLSFIKFVDRYLFWFKSNSNNRHFTWRPLCDSARRSEWEGIHHIGNQIGYRLDVFPWYRYGQARQAPRQILTSLEKVSS